MRPFSLSVGFALAAMAAAEPTWYVVTDNEVHVRCGADSSYYAFATAQEGDLVAVIGEKVQLRPHPGGGKCVR